MLAWGFALSRDGRRGRCPSHTVNEKQGGTGLSLKSFILPAASHRLPSMVCVSWHCWRCLTYSTKIDTGTLWSPSWSSVPLLLIYLLCVTHYILNNILVSGIKHLLIKFTIDIKTSGGGKWDKMQNQNVIEETEKSVHINRKIQMGLNIEKFIWWGREEKLSKHAEAKWRRPGLL